MFTCMPVLKHQYTDQLIGWQKTYIPPHSQPLSHICLQNLSYMQYKDKCALYHTHICGGIKAIRYGSIFVNEHGSSLKYAFLVVWMQKPMAVRSKHRISLSGFGAVIPLALCPHKTTSRDIVVLSNCLGFLLCSQSKFLKQELKHSWMPQFIMPRSCNRLNVFRGTQNRGKRCRKTY